MKIGIEVVTGFLGAGKSAFINSLIDKTIAENEKIVVLFCESGNTIIKEKNEKGKSVKVIPFMDEGYKLKDKLLNIIKIYKPNRIIIEYNGTESLEYLYKSIYDKTLEKLCKVYTMYFICDAKNISFYIKNMGDILLPFIQKSDILIVNNYENYIDKKFISNKKNKTSNIKDENLSKVISELESLNNRAHIIFAKNNYDIANALENSNLIESKVIRNIKVKILNSLNSKVSR